MSECSLEVRLGAGVRFPAHQRPEAGGLTLIVFSNIEPIGSIRRITSVNPLGLVRHLPRIMVHAELRAEFAVNAVQRASARRPWSFASQHQQVAMSYNRVVNL